jgi:Putative amidoligase enzyme
MTTVLQHFGLSPVSSILISVRNYKETPDLVLSNPDLYVGLELEIEGWNDDYERAFRGFRFETDGSLRNNGIEAITLPLKSKHVPYLLTTFFKNKGITERNYSGRCSTHVHVDAQQLTIEQVQSVCLLYQTLERVLFDFIGNDRDNNIFCVPWYQCSISQDFVRKFANDANYTTRSWQKYTALNILPLRSQGTLEFRHLEGTCDVTRITNWLNILGCIVKYTVDNSLDDIKQLILNMNTVSNYGAFVENVFGQWAPLLTSNPDYQLSISNGVIDSKICLLNDKPIKDTETRRPATITLDIEAYTTNATIRPEFFRPREMPVHQETLGQYLQALERQLNQGPTTNNTTN